MVKKEENGTPLLFFVALHKEAPLPPPCEHYVALGIGGYHPTTSMRVLSDDVGDSISTKNQHYSELSGWYWIWKNISAVKLIGLNHYRRYFFLDPSDSRLFERAKLYADAEEGNFLETIASSDRNAFVEETLSKVDVIVPRRQTFAMPISQLYIHHHYREDWELFMAGIEKLFPRYASEIAWFDQAFHLHPYNMMIATKEFFDVYMSSLFKLLFWMEEKRPFRTEPYQCRVPAFIAERFLTFYLHVNRTRYAEVPVFISDRSAF